MNRKILFVILIAIVVIAAGTVIFWKYGTSKNEIVYYYGEGCPHCANVDAFLQENKIEEKISFVKKEVFNNGENAKELTSIAQSVGLSMNDIGVPFVWDGSHYYMGETDIINFFKQKVGIQ